MQGWRRTNEDAHICNLDIGDGVALFAVFDGHGDDKVAKYLQENLLSRLASNKFFISDI